MDIKIIKVKSKINGEVLLTSLDWPERLIDGVAFVAVKYKVTDTIPNWMRKDNIEYLK